uniref:Titin n=1 Tax=Falco tinnunculus TaxID=100819 RepID=A0A8C4UEI0_FALTI
SEPQSIKVMEKTVATFFAKVGGDPIPNVKWLKGKWRQLNQGGRIIIQQRGDEAKLEIKDAIKTDSGMYKCVAFNQHGEIERSVNLQVEERKKEVVEGDLRAKLKSTPTKKKEEEEQPIDILELLKNVDPKEYEKYARMYGITDFRGLLQAFELLKQTQAEESHRLVRYSMTAALQKAGYNLDLFYQKFYLFLLEPPVEFTKPLEDQTVEEEATAILECEVSRENAKVKWFKNGEEIHKTKKYDIISDGRIRKLIIRGCTLDDAKTYTCDAKDFKTSCFLNVEREKGKKYDIISKGAEHILVVSKCVFDDEAEYACEAKTARTSGLLTVIGKHSPLEDIETMEKKTVTFWCKVNRLNATLKWTKNGEEITFNKRVLYKIDKYKHSLIIKDCGFIDEGEYTVTAGQDKSVAELLITEAPADFIEIKTGDQNLVVDVGKPLTMTVPYDAYPRAEAEWLKGEESLPTATVDTTTDCTTFKIYKAKKSDKGRYKVVLRNKHGQAEAFINVEVIDVPGPVRNLEVTETYDGEVGLAWQEPESDGGSKIIGYVIERRDIKRKTWVMVTDRAENCEYTVTGLQKGGVEYLFRVSARNRVGTGEPVETETPVEAKNVPGPPQNVEVTDVNRFGATLTWEPPEYDGGSPVTGYVIELRNRGSIKWEPAMTTGADELSAVLTDVVENEEYFFRVRAQNMVGVGKPSPATRAVKIMDPISKYACTLIVIALCETGTFWPNPTSKGIFLTWEPPKYDGGARIKGYLVEKSQRISFQLTVMEVTKLKEGEWYAYRVKALNRIGASKPSKPTDDIQAIDAKEIFLDVKLLAGLTVKAGTKIELPAKVTGKPEPQITWTKADKILRPDDRITIETKPNHSTVTITDSKRSDSGTYIIELCKQKVNIHILCSTDKPGPPAAFDVSEITNESCLLTWNPPRDDGGSKITNYVLEKRATDSEIWHKLSSTIKDTKFRATNLTPHKEYVFRVSAENMYGVGEPAQCNPIIAKYSFVKGLTNKKKYKFRVLAENLAGPGKPSKETEPILVKDPIGIINTFLMF